ncbi:MAG: hypothetical protein WAY93_08765 [Atopobiaceae bacterium]|jgi:hypothetical protein|nr:hypothetical protein [Atopobiaceae bacterium]
MQEKRLPPRLAGLPPIVIVVGHYGVGKTNFALNLASDLALAGRKVTVADLDIVNPFFRSSDYEGLLSGRGIDVIKPELAGSALDVPALSGRIDTAIDQAQGSDGKETLVLDVGGDDVGAVALGRYSKAIARAPYAMLYVVNAFRDDGDDVGLAASLLSEIEADSHLEATAIVGNSHLQSETDAETIARGAEFAERVSHAVDLPVWAVTSPDASLVEKKAGPRGLDSYIVSVYVKTPWDVSDGSLS